MMMIVSNTAVSNGLSYLPLATIDTLVSSSGQKRRAGLEEEDQEQQPIKRTSRRITPPYSSVSVRQRRPPFDFANVQENHGIFGEETQENEEKEEGDDSEEDVVSRKSRVDQQGKHVKKLTKSRGNNQEMETKRPEKTHDNEDNNDQPEEDDKVEDIVNIDTGSEESDEHDSEILVDDEDEEVAMENDDEKEEGISIEEESVENESGKETEEESEEKESGEEETEEEPEEEDPGEEEIEEESEEEDPGEEEIEEESEEEDQGEEEIGEESEEEDQGGEEIEEESEEEDQGGEEIEEESEKEDQGEEEIGEESEEEDPGEEETEEETEENEPSKKANPMEISNKKFHLSYDRDLSHIITNWVKFKAGMARWKASHRVTTIRIKDGDTVTREKLERFIREGTAQESHIDTKNPCNSIEPFMIRDGDTRRCQMDTVRGYVSAIRMLYQIQHDAPISISDARKDLALHEINDIMNANDRLLENSLANKTTSQSVTTLNKTEVRIESVAKARSKKYTEDEKQDTDDDRSEEIIDIESIQQYLTQAPRRSGNMSKTSLFSWKAKKERRYFKDWKVWCTNKNYPDGYTVTRDKMRLFALELVIKKANINVENHPMNSTQYKSMLISAISRELCRNIWFIGRIYLHQCIAERKVPNRKHDLGTTDLETIIRETVLSNGNTRLEDSIYKNNVMSDADDQSQFTTGIALDRLLRKSYKDQERYSVFLREENVEICPVGALSFYLLSIWTNEKFIVDLRSRDWEDKRLLAFKGSLEITNTTRQVFIVI
ncbi:hypothetical protein FBU30_003808 [Linnemannia zychae]|nr:hypothetical protein FBU30_003808 [Linnemannia zychae]